MTPAGPVDQSTRRWLLHGVWFPTQNHGPWLVRLLMQWFGVLQASVPIYKARKSSWFLQPSTEANLYHFHRSQWITNKSPTIRTKDRSAKCCLLMNLGQGLTEHGAGGRGCIWEMPSVAHVFSHLTRFTLEVGIIAHLYKWRSRFRWVKSLACCKSYAWQSWSSTRTVQSKNSLEAFDVSYQNRGRGVPQPVLPGAGSGVVKLFSPL